ncbi:MAG: DUF2510 domain-containing protein [Candidatus Nanopelagicales bacterium]
MSQTIPSPDQSTLALTRVSGAPADWYPDPTHPGQYRYWDGNFWTDLARPSIPYQPATHYRASEAPAFVARKSPGLAFLMVLLFGPFGWIYISPLAGLLAVGGGMVLWHFLGLLALLVYPFAWIASWVLAPLAAASATSRARRLGSWLLRGRPARAAHPQNLLSCADYSSVGAGCAHFGVSP